MDVNKKEHVRCKYPDGTIVEGVVQDKGENGILICTTLYPGGQYNYGDQFICDPMKDEVKKLSKKDMSFSYIPYINNITKVSSSTIDIKPYINRANFIASNLSKEINSGNVDLKEDFIKVCSLFKNKYANEEKLPHWNNVMEKKCWRFLLNSLSMLQNLYLPEVKSAYVSDDHIEEDMQKFKEIEQNTEEIQKDIDELQQDDIKVKKQSGKPYGPSSPKGAKITGFCPKCLKDVIMTNLDPGYEKCDTCGGEFSYQEIWDALDANGGQKPIIKEFNKTSKRTNQPFDKHKSQYKFDPNEGIIYKDISVIEKVASIKKLLSGVDQIKGKTVIYQDEVYTVESYELIDGIFHYKLKNNENGKEVSDVKGNELFFPPSKNKKVSHKLPQEEELFLKQSFEVLKTALDHYIKEDDPSYLQQIIGRCDLIQNECRKVIEQHNITEKTTKTKGETNFSWNETIPKLFQNNK